MFRIAWTSEKYGNGNGSWFKITKEKAQEDSDKMDECWPEYKHFVEEKKDEENA